MQILEEKEFVEDNTLMDQKIIIGILAVAVALVSQFYKKGDEDWKFPKDKGFQAVCVVCYGILSLLYYYVDTIKKGDCFFTS